MKEESEHHQQERKGNCRESFPNVVVLCNVGRLELPQLGSQIVCRHFRDLWASPMAHRVKNLPADAGDPRNAGSIPGLGRSSGGGNSNPPQYSCLENSVDRGAWQVTIHGVTKSQT